MVHPLRRALPVTRQGSNARTDASLRGRRGDVHGKVVSRSLRSAWFAASRKNGTPKRSRRCGGATNGSTSCDSRSRQALRVGRGRYPDWEFGRRRRATGRLALVPGDEERAVVLVRVEARIFGTCWESHVSPSTMRSLLAQLPVGRTVHVVAQVRGNEVVLCNGAVREVGGELGVIVDVAGATRRRLARGRADDVGKVDDGLCFAA